MEKKEVLAQSFLFQGLGKDQIQLLADIASPRSYTRGRTIFLEGDPGIGFYMVVSGKVKIYKMSLEGKEQILHIFGPGEPFGEVPVFHGTPFPASATRPGEH